MEDNPLCDGNSLQWKDGKEVVAIHYDASQLHKLTIYDYTKELLDKNDKVGVRLTQAEVNWFFEGNVMSVFAESHPKRSYLLRQTRCAIIMEFWAKRENKPRNVSDDRSMFQVQERDAGTADGLRTVMVHGNDQVIVKYAATHGLGWLNYQAMASHVHKMSGQRHIRKEMMDRLWLGIVYNLFWFECPCFKRKKTLEMNYEPARKYWEDFNRTKAVPNSSASTLWRDDASPAKAHLPLATPPPVNRSPQPVLLPPDTDGRHSTTNGGSATPGFGHQRLPYRPTAQQFSHDDYESSRHPFTPPSKADRPMYSPTRYPANPPSNDDDAGYSRLLQKLGLPPVQPALQPARSPGFEPPLSAPSTPGRSTHTAGINDDESMSKFQNRSR